MRIAFVLALLASLPAGAEPRFRVWAVGDSVRINPLSGKAYEENRLVFPDATKAGYRESNLIWDGRTGRVTLHAARNEIVAFQVVVERTTDSPLTDVAVAIDDLAGPGGKRLPPGNVQLFKEWYVDVTKRSAQDYSLGTGYYPDALIPVRGRGKLFPRSFIVPFEIPDQLNNIGPVQRNQALWVDIYVPREREQAPRGEYHAKIRVVSGTDTASLDLLLKVWDFALPDENHLGGDIHTDTELHTFDPELELRYYQLARRHRVVLGELGYTPDMEISGTDVKIDWRKYDERLAKYLDGRAFTREFGYDGPGYGVPIELLVLPFDAYPTNVYYNTRNVGWPYGKEFKFYRPWPVELPKQGITPEYTAIWRNTFRAFDQHFEDHPEWNRTKPIVFMLSLDESYDEPSIQSFLYYGGLMKEAGKHLKFRIDGSYPMDTMDRLAKVVDIVILGVRSYVPERVRQLREKGLEDWFYSGMGNIDGDPLGCRALAWVSWKYGAKSWAIWEMDFNSLRAWLYPETYTERNGDIQNGQAMYVYRGETMGLEEPVASIRLKLMRRGAQDYEYFWLLAQKSGGKAKADAIANAVIHEPLGTHGAWGSPSMWKHNAEDWERGRLEMGDLIEPHSN